MGELLNFQKQNNPETKAENSTENTRPPLVDVVAGFTFSRLPLEQRIAQTLKNILVKEGYGGILGEIDTLTIAIQLAKYSVKDFAVRYGHLEDGNGKA